MCRYSLQARLLVSPGHFAPPYVATETTLRVLLCEPEPQVLLQEP